MLQVHHSSMPIYKVGKRLGKGGFGQVFLAARMKQRKVTPVNKPNQVHHLSPLCTIKPCATFLTRWPHLQHTLKCSISLSAQVAIKFEHVSSKGCLTNGKPAEWSVYSAIGSCPGIPKVYARTTQASFHILVSLPCLAHATQSQLSKWWASCGSLGSGKLQPHGRHAGS